MCWTFVIFTTGGGFTIFKGEIVNLFLAQVNFGLAEVRVLNINNIILRYKTIFFKLLFYYSIKEYNKFQDIFFLNPLYRECGKDAWLFSIIMLAVAAFGTYLAKVIHSDVSVVVSSFPFLCLLSCPGMVVECELRAGNYHV